jgi:hypothetical protein
MSDSSDSSANTHSKISYLSYLRKQVSRSLDERMDSRLRGNDKEKN